MKNSWVSRSLLLHFVASLIIEFWQIMATFKLNVNLNFRIWHKDWYLGAVNISEHVCIQLLIADWENGIGRQGHDYRIQNVFCLVDCSVTTLMWAPHNVIITARARADVTRDRSECDMSRVVTRVAASPAHVLGSWIIIIFINGALIVK